MDIALTGKQATVRGITIFRFAKSNIAEGLTPWDALDVLQQLGVIPAPGHKPSSALSPSEGNAYDLHE